MLTEPLLLTCASALGLGLRHALDSDHVAAITTMVTAGHGPKQAALVGASWGLGHGLAVVGAGAVLVALGVQVPPSLAVALEGVVVVMLLVLGYRTATAGDAAITAPAAVAPASPPKRASMRAAMVGLVHGASGTAALALLVLSTLRSRAEGVTFLLVFAAGATLSMTLLSYLLAVPLRAATVRFRHGARALRLAAGAFSLGAAALLLAGLLGGAS